MQFFMEGWVGLFKFEVLFMDDVFVLENGFGEGLVEVVCGVFGYWVQIENGCIVGYQIVVLIIWNFSLCDFVGNLGLVEVVFVGVLVGEYEDMFLLVQYIVCSFDFCMVCMVY